MATKKAGTVLINRENKEIALIQRKDGKGLEFPKGHLEEGETLQECAIRETEEETRRKNHLLSDKEVDIIEYITSSGEDVELYMYLAIDDGPTDKNILEEDMEDWIWVNINEVEQRLDFQNLKEFWKKVKNKVLETLK